MNKIGKIIELLVDWEQMDFDEVGISIMSLVDKPALGISWQQFSEETDREMIDGIINLLNGVEDMENRKVMATEAMDSFEQDGIEWDREDFLQRIGLHEGENGELMIGVIHTDPIIVMASNPEFGEVLDYANTIEISESQAKFSDFTNTLRGIIGLDILGKKNPTEEGEIKYRYAGPVAQRVFCRAMLRLNKVYTREEIDQMSGFNPGFGARGSNSYDIFKYKGGPNCQHYWEQVRVFREGNRTVVVSEGPAEGLAAIPMQDQPNSGYLMSSWNFSDEDQMIVTGPAMIPNIMIPRADEDGNTFHVYFTEETIKKIAKKFLEESKHNNTDINHNDIIVNENTLLESWIVEDPEMDKSKILGFNVPKGTWMVSYKINNEETWDKIKSGELNGFSITGQFIERAIKKEKV
jgi:hypothetical protein